MKKILKSQAEDYWQYRLVRVIYLIISVPTVIGCAFWVYNSIPKVDMFGSTYSTRCTTGTYAFGQFSESDITFDEDKPYNAQVFRYKEPYDDVYSKLICDKGGNMSQQDQTALFDAAYLGGTIISDNASRPTNYTIYISKKAYSPDLDDLKLAIISSLIIFAIAATGLPQLFNYVVFGKEPEEEDCY